METTQYVSSYYRTSDKVIGGTPLTTTEEDELSAIRALRSEMSREAMNLSVPLVHIAGHLRIS